MKYNHRIPVCFLFTAIILFSVKSHGQLQVDTGNKALLKKIDRSFSNAGNQYKLLAAQVSDSVFPKTFDAAKNKIETSNSGWWCSGFYPGSLLYLYRQTKDPVLYNEAVHKLKILQQEQFNTHTHDLGFMMYCSFGNANLIKHSVENDSILLRSARSLSTRFNPAVGCIKSWDGKPNEFLVIIDNMMNLELLFWAARYSGDSSFYKIAITHANTTIKNHFRSDNSSYHVINYDATTGKVVSRRTAQGAADSSAWARGQAWGLYGFTVMYRETKDPIYLQQANKIASFILDHPNFPTDKIPYWDFNAPGIPNALRDASAAAIIASALIELSTYSDKPASKKYISVAETILNTLLSEKYTATSGSNGGFILKHGVGHKPAGTEVDEPLSYADYYFIEAMTRYKEQFSSDLR